MSPYPEIPEQRAIAHILGTLDEKIELNRRMNETLEAMARALFKSWFVDFRSRPRQDSPETPQINHSPATSPSLPPGGGVGKPRASARRRAGGGPARQGLQPAGEPVGGD